MGAYYQFWMVPMKKYRSFLPTLLIIIVLIGVVFSLTACNALENQSIKNEPSFRLAMLDSSKISWPKGNVYFTWETLWPLLKQAYPSAVAYSLKEADIESYDWTRQVITLTPEASEMLLDTFACSNIARINPNFCLEEYRFLVALNDLPIYGGEFTEIISVLPRLVGKIGKKRLSLKDEQILIAKWPNQNSTRCSPRCGTKSRTYGEASNSRHIEHLVGTTRNGGQRICA